MSWHLIILPCFFNPHISFLPQWTTSNYCQASVHAVMEPVPYVPSGHNSVVGFLCPLGRLWEVFLCLSMRFMTFSLIYVIKHPGAKKSGLLELCLVLSLGCEASLIQDGFAPWAPVIAKVTGVFTQFLWKNTKSVFVLHLRHISIFLHHEFSFKISHTKIFSFI